MPTTVTCPGCGGSVPVADRFCGACGTPISGSAVMSGEGARFDPWVELLQTLRLATVGEYEILDELGRGGMAAVFLAQDLQLNRKVAIKVMLPGLVYGATMWDRFLSEARTAAKLDHPNVIYIHSVREKERFLYFVMKYIDGRSLDDILLHSEALPLPVAQTILVEVARALDYAHHERVVHRDIKPANIMIDQKGHAIVMDFGIARATDEKRFTQTGATIGTPAYMSPEQCRGRETTAASDQYSLGVLAYEMLAGVPPFSGTPLELQIAHMQDTPRTLRDLRPEVSVELSDTVMRMLAKDPDERWTSLQELVPIFGRGLDTTDTGPRDYLVSLVLAGLERRKSLSATPVSPAPESASPAELSPDAVPADRAATPIVPSLAVRVRPARRSNVPVITLVGAAAAALLWAAPSRARRREATPSSDSIAAPVAANGSPDAVTPSAAAAVDAAFGDSVVVGHGADATTRVRGKVPRTVTPDAVSFLVVTITKPHVKVGDTVRVSLEVQDDAGAPVTTHQIVWTTSNPRIARFLAPGQLIASRAGKATITVAVGSASTKEELTVEARGAAPSRRRPAR